MNLEIIGFVLAIKHLLLAELNCLNALLIDIKASMTLAINKAHVLPLQCPLQAETGYTSDHMPRKWPRKGAIRIGTHVPVQVIPGLGQVTVRLQRVADGIADSGVRQRIRGVDEAYAEVIGRRVVADLARHAGYPEYFCIEPMSPLCMDSQHPH
jgi:hypothetical protein